MRRKWTKRAAANLRSIYAEIAKDRPTAAQNMVERIHLIVRHLADHPELGVENSRLPGTRRLVVAKTYIVIYRIRADYIEILRIYHHAQKRP